MPQGAQHRRTPLVYISDVWCISRMSFAYVLIHWPRTGIADVVFLPRVFSAFGGPHRRIPRGQIGQRFEQRRLVDPRQLQGHFLRGQDGRGVGSRRCQSQLLQQVRGFWLISIAFSLLLLFLPFFALFLDASSHLYKRPCPSVGLSVGHAFVKIDEKRPFMDSK